MDGSGVIARSYSQPVGSSTDVVCVGQALREARIRAGLELDQISTDLKISSRYLRAIEEMDRNALPHRAYALGFVRCYATYLGFNPKTSVDQFKSANCAQQALSQDISVIQPPFWLDFTLPRGVGIAIVMIGILGLAGWFGARNEVSPHRVPAVPEMLGTWSQNNDLHNIPAIKTKKSATSKAGLYTQK